MTNAIVKHNDIINSLDEVQRVAKMYAVSRLFAAQGDSVEAIAKIATQIMAGRELGLGPFASVQGIHIIQGRPALSANLMAAAVKSHPRYNYKVKEMTDKNVSIEFFEDGESIGVSSFSTEDAKKAGTKNLDKFPRNMLFARAMSNGVRWFCPDVFAGNAVYTPDELGADVDDEGEYIAHSGKANGNGNGGYRVVEPIDSEQAEQEREERIVAEQETMNAQVEPLHPIVAEWLNAANPAADAKAWAVEVGAQSNDHAARNSLKKIVDSQFGGKFTKENAAAVLTAFHARQSEHVESKAVAVEVNEVEAIPA